MPDLIQHSILTHNPLPPSLYVAPPSETPPPSAPPEPPGIWDPRKPGYSGPFPWEEHPAFRFTFLVWFTRPEDRELLEGIGRLLYDMALEVCGSWPKLPESTTRAEMRAVAQDLRHAQSFLLSLGASRNTASLQGEDERLALMAESWADHVGRVAGGLEGAVWPLPGTGGSYYP